MATNVVAPGADEPRDERPPQRPAAGRPSVGGYFTIHKKGQGYWTRMGTAFGAALILALTAYTIHNEAPRIGLGNHRQLATGIAIGVFVVGAAVAWYLMNKPSNVDFLIATDSEMKKVNWTSRKDLIGSTKVVIVFMFLIALFLFLIDILFSYFFYLIGVLKHSPLGGGGTIGGG